MKKELVFGVGCEGEGDDIFRITEDDGSVYYIQDHSTMFDKDDMGEDWEPPKSKKWATFEIKHRNKL